MPGSRPPANSMKRYSGNLRGMLMQAHVALTRAQAYDAAYRAKPTTAYPQQLASAADMAVLTAALNTLTLLVAAKGPIPNR